MKNYLSLKVQMVFVALAGLQLIFIPNVVLGWFGFAPTHEIWIRVLGVVIGILAILYYGILKTSGDMIIMYTVYGRLTASFGIIALAIVLGPQTLALLAIPDMLTAIWTWMELRKAGSF